MADIKQALQTIEGKLRMLAFTNEETHRVREKEDVKKLERHGRVLEELIDSVYQQKTKVQTLRIERGDESDEVKQWTYDLELKMAVYEEAMQELETEVNDLRRSEQKTACEEEERREEEKRKRHFEEEIKLEEAKMRVKQEFEMKMEENRSKSQKDSSTVKLPKLQITKFQGTHLDWQRFWSQFQTEVDNADKSQVSKFSYLKEYLTPKVRLLVDGLPFNAEGYDKAKNILQTKYGKPSEVANAHTQQIIGLSVIQGSQPSKIHDFYETLVTNVQALQTMKKINDINGYVRVTLDKLPGIRADLVRFDDDWQEWGFPEMIEALRKWCDRNPVRTEEKKADKPARPPFKPIRGEKSFQVKHGEGKARPCVYCDSGEHKSAECANVQSHEERKGILSKKRLCFNCTGARHRASECRSATCCQKCSGKHHTSICDKEPKKSPLLSVPKEEVIYPVVLVKVDGIECRALLDSGAGSSYASAILIERLSKRPARIEYKRIDMMMCSKTERLEVYNAEITGTKGDFAMVTELNKVDKSVLLSISNPNYNEKIKRYPHLTGVVMEDSATKAELPVHLILGASDYSRIKTTSNPKVGQPGEPIAELTKFGWSMMSPGKELNLSSVKFVKSSAADYQQLCSLDVMGLEDRPFGDQKEVHNDFEEQLSRNQDGWYETGLIWKQDHDELLSNKQGSLKRLEGLVKKLQRKPGLLEQYDEIIQEQIAEGMVERVTEEPVGNEFYIPHKPVIREDAESTKIRIVFDASARPSEKSPSLNDCLETGPPLQNLLWDVLVRNRLKPVALAGDLKKAFLQVRIGQQDRDALRFHWLRNRKLGDIEVLRFTRALFGLVQSPFLLGATLQHHLQALRETYPKEVEEIMKSLYVDDVITGGATTEEVQQLKETAITIFGDAKFELHKWHSNVATLETESRQGGEQTFAKEQLGVKPGETKLLGLPWNKENDTLLVTFPEAPSEVTKREILRFLASVYDPLGLVSPTTLVGKILYRATCDQHLSWDGKLPEKTEKEWRKFEKSLPISIEVPRSIPFYQEATIAVDLHVFGDTSGAGTSAAAYVVVHQPSGVSQGLLTAKSRLAKKGLTIPRLELVSAHMAANLAENVKNALEGQPLRSVTGWVDSTAALHWIQGDGVYKQFVTNRVRKIREKAYIEWRHVGTNQNPADIGSRGCGGNKLPDKWLRGPDWLATREQWPVNVVTKASQETEAEAKLIKEVFAASIEGKNELEELLDKHSYWMTIRITAWIARFLTNCKLKKVQRVTGPLTTIETSKQVQWWVKHAQEDHEQTDQFQEDRLRLNLQKNSEGIYECRGRIQGSYPVYLPPDAVFSKKTVQDAHELTLHGGVGLTMTLVRRDYWIPRLRQLTKKVIKDCMGCRRFQAIAYQSPPPGQLPVDRTVGSTPFQVVGVDYAGPLPYKVSAKKAGKAHILLFACSLTRAIHLELLNDQTTEGFVRSLKRFIARRGRPQKIYSDNGKSFVAAAKWLRGIMKDERLQDYLAHQNIVWQFNLSRAPWWGGQFERLVGLVKTALYKSVGRAYLTWNEFEEVLLDIETALNNRPLMYVEDDVQLPVLTPSAMMFGQPNLLPAEDEDALEDVDLKKRAKYLRRCKDVLWSRWTTEYIRSLRERHNLSRKTPELSIKVGDVVLIQSKVRNRGKWNIGIVTELIKGKDGIIRAAKLRAGKSYLERAVQHLCPMELSCDRSTGEKGPELNPSAREFTPRKAAIEAARRIREIASQEETEH